MNYTIATIAPIFLLPFFAFVINCVFIKKIPKIVPWISIAGIVGAFFYASAIFMDFFSVYNTDYYIHKVFNWIDISHGENIFKIDLGVYIDNMTAVMLLMVTGVASLIHIFSSWYMKGDVRWERFFLYLSLFTSAMLGLVLSDNLLSVFMFWEVMGFCSYSLIGFYFEKEEAGNASLKAFMTTRVGDVFFLLGILAIWSVVGSVDFPSIYAAIADGAFTGKTVFGMSLATFSAFCIFCGTIGKSAQFPLQVWLPDAMMGPTPCSALIHAATMVAAGVYLSLRAYPLIFVGELNLFIAYIGGITAFGAATIAIIQKDLKAVLAYSTISQLGYMVLGIGVGSYNAAFMHLITHAIFKACLFLAAGSVIHSYHAKYMTEMGGLRKKLPYTWIAMWCCTLAIAGVPFFSGFVSKDRILGDALYMMVYSGIGAYSIPAILGFIGAFLTPFYMFRMMFLTFHGKNRNKEKYDHCHKEHLKWNQNVPLLILSVFTLGVFFCGSMTGQGIIKVAHQKLEWFKVLVEAPVGDGLNKFKSYTKQGFSNVDTRENTAMESSLYDSHYHTGFAGEGFDHKNEQAHHDLHHAHVEGAVASVVIVIFSILLAFAMYIFGWMNPNFFYNKLGFWVKAIKNKYFFDWFYVDIVIKKGLLRLNRFLSWFDSGIYDRYAIDGWATINRYIFKASHWFDRVVVDSIAVDGTAVGTQIFSLVTKSIQSGYIQKYIIALVGAIVVISMFLGF